MSADINNARAIADAWNSPGGQLIRAQIEEMVKDNRSYLDHLMQDKPEQLTGKIALSRSGRLRALSDLKEWVADEMRPLDAK